MAARDWTGRSPEDTMVHRLLARYGVALLVYMLVAAILVQAALIMTLTLARDFGSGASGLRIGTVTLPSLVFTLMGFGLGLFDGWQVQEHDWRRRLGRIAGHGLLGALVGATTGGVAIVGGLVLVLVLGLFLGLLGSLF